MSTTTDTTQDTWWADDPNVAACASCGCPVQGGPLGMSQHKATVHPVPRSPHRPRATS